MTLHYAGNKKEQLWIDLWVIAESIDLRLEQAYQEGTRLWNSGYQNVCWVLSTDDSVEHWLNRIAAQQAFQVTGDVKLMQTLQSSVAPGSHHLAPAWSVSAALEQNRQEYLQQGRVRGSTNSQAQDASGGQDDRPPRRPKRRPKNPSAKPVAAPKGKGAKEE